MTPPHSRLDDLKIERGQEPASPRSRVAIATVLVLLLVGAGAAWWFLRPQPLEVQTATARSPGGSAADRTVLNASGYVTARREATVSSKVMGKVAELLIEEGMRVKEGDVLARLDATNVQASLQLARAQLDSTKNALAETDVRIKEAELEWQRQSALIKGNVVSRSDYDRADAALNALRARLNQQRSDVVVAERSIAIWEQQLEDMTIRAPFGGIVTSKNAQPGEMISPMSSGGFTRTGICTVVDMDSLEIEIDVNESYINRVTPGQPVEASLDAYPEWRIPCKVIAIIPTADRQKSTVRVRVGFDQLDARILPQMAVKVAFRDAAPTIARDAAAPNRHVVIPKRALRSADERDVVFVLQGDRVERRAVTVARVQDNDAQVSAGVSAGEKVIVDPPADLRDGMTVKVATP